MNKFIATVGRKRYLDDDLKEIEEIYLHRFDTDAEDIIIDNEIYNLEIGGLYAVTVNHNSVDFITDQKYQFKELNWEDAKIT